MQAYSVTLLLYDLPYNIYISKITSQLISVNLYSSVVLLQQFIKENSHPLFHWERMVCCAGSLYYTVVVVVLTQMALKMTWTWLGILKPDEMSKGWIWPSNQGLILYDTYGKPYMLSVLLFRITAKCLLAS